MTARPLPGGRGPLNRKQPWSTWWVLLFGAVAVGLLIAVCLRAPFQYWAPLAALTFLPMELYGLRDASDPYPPLTQITREWCPRWLTFLLIYGFAALAGGTWFHFHRRWWLAALGALLGWLTAHFDVTYDAPAVAQENAKYQWYATKLHLNALQGRLVTNQQQRDSRESA